ncbi:hypothetical protein Fmac_021253 [Flemingia macrophylla]|uniref:RNase III domain-containing protein n=1 Tax=Flemingia macrophylla TaxID=520843 RepID=A0ABD1LWF0_9FABA
MFHPYIRSLQVSLESSSSEVLSSLTLGGPSRFYPEKAPRGLREEDVLQAITAKECSEAYDYNYLETLGDSFLKYAVGQQLFKTNQDDREGALSKERARITSNVALFKNGCCNKLPGFIRKENFDPKQWSIPGDKSKSLLLKEELVSDRKKIYVHRTRKMGFKIIADVVEALIGAFISIDDEEGALSFINWIGIKVDTNIVPYETHLSVDPGNLVDVKLLESLLNNYKFKDPYFWVQGGCFRKRKTLLEPLVTPETARKHPINELKELCRKEGYKIKVYPRIRDNNETSVKIKVVANGIAHQHTGRAFNKVSARKVASKEVLKLIKICKSLG